MPSDGASRRFAVVLVRAAHSRAARFPSKSRIPPRCRLPSIERPPETTRKDERDTKVADSDAGADKCREDVRRDPGDERQHGERREPDRVQSDDEADYVVGQPGEQEEHPHHHVPGLAQHVVDPREGGVADPASTYGRPSRRESAKATTLPISTPTRL